MPRPLHIALVGMLLPACPLYGRGDCTVDRAACPTGTTCDIRSGICVRLVGTEVSRGQSGKDDASGGVGGSEIESADAAATSASRLNSTGGESSAAADGGLATE